MTPASDALTRPEGNPLVQTTINYLAAMEEKPHYFLYPPPQGTPWRNTRGDRRSVTIHDARELAPSPSLDEQGFALVRHETAVTDFTDADAIRRRYYPEMEALVRGATGAARVLAFDHNVRSAATDGRAEAGVQPPVHYAHNDYTVASGPRRVRDLLPREAEALLRRRFAVINVWKPIRQPVRRTPLAVCDARSIDRGDLIATDLRYRDRTGEVYSLRFSARHRWYYYSEMRPDEALLLKCYDSDVSRASFSAHSAFDDPSSPPDAPARESIEVRTLAFF